MKKITAIIVTFGLLFLSAPFIASAISSSVDRITDHIQPLISTDYIKAPYFVASSTTATSTFAGKVDIGTTTSISNSSFLNVAGNAHFGTSTCPYPADTLMSPTWEFCGSDNTANGVNLVIANTNSGANAFSDIFFQNSDSLTQQTFGVLGMNSPNYTDTTYGTLSALPNQLQLYNTQGVLTLAATNNLEGATTTAFINFATGGTDASNERMRIDNNGAVEIGTTSPFYGSLLTVDGEETTYGSINVINSDADPVPTVTVSGQNDGVYLDSGNFDGNTIGLREYNNDVNIATFDMANNRVNLGGNITNTTGIGGGLVGISSSTPDSKLSVVGQDVSSNVVSVQIENPTDYTQLGLSNSAAPQLTRLSEKDDGLSFWENNLNGNNGDAKDDNSLSAWRMYEGDNSDGFNSFGIQTDAEGDGDWGVNFYQPLSIANNGVETMSGTSGGDSGSLGQLNITPDWYGGGGAWIDLPTDGPSGIGTGGPGSNPFIAYVASNGQWFNNSITGATAYRNDNDLEFGSSGEASGYLTMKITDNGEFHVEDPEQDSSLGSDCPTFSNTVNGSGEIKIGDINNCTRGGVASFSPSQTIFSNMNVGIATTSPGTILSVGTGSNYINISNTATSTFSHGINVQSGCVAVAGTCLGSGGSSLIGSTGQTAYFSGTNTAVGTSTIRINTNQSVGISTTSTASVLNVGGTVRADTFNSDSPNNILDLNGSTFISAPGAGNTFFGGSGNLTLTGTGNLAFGSTALAQVTSGFNDTAIGGAALNSDQNGQNDVALGNQSMEFNTSGYANTGVGNATLFRNLTGTSNVGIGDGAGYGTPGDSYNNDTFVGSSAGVNITTGGNNTYIGENSAPSATSGNGNIVIGYNTDVLSATISNELNIGNTLYGNLANGYVGIGSTSPTSLLSIGTTSTSFSGSLLTIASSTNNNIFNVAANGNLSVDATSTANDTLLVNQAVTGLNNGVENRALSVKTNGNEIFGVGAYDNSTNPAIFIGSPNGSNSSLTTRIYNGETGQGNLDLFSGFLDFNTTAGTIFTGAGGAQWQETGTASATSTEFQSNPLEFRDSIWLNGASANHIDRIANIPQNTGLQDRMAFILNRAGQAGGAAYEGMSLLYDGIGAANLGLSTTSPTYQFSVGSSTASIANFAVDSYGNQYGGGGKPSVSCLGTCALDTNAHDSSGIIYLSGVQTSVTLTFYTPKPWAPHCTVSDNTTAGNYDASSTPTTLVMSTSVSLGTASVSYQCDQ